MTDETLELIVVEAVRAETAAVVITAQTVIAITNVNFRLFVKRIMYIFVLYIKLRIYCND
jgi:hypothetical protein